MRLVAGLWGLMVVFSGCVQRSENAVVIYSAADREYAKPILAAFERRQTGMELAAQYDIESTKTVGLVTRLESEASRPRCDVFWNNEIMHTLRLQKAGLLQSVRWDVPGNWPQTMKADDGTWLGFAARARIIMLNQDMFPEGVERPQSFADLASPKWQGKCAVALPLFGTTATHFTVLDQLLGKERAHELFANIKQNAVVLSGNKQVAQAVSSGTVAWGITATDDALVELDAGLPVEIVYPDQAPAELGTLRIPNTIAVLKGAPHPVAAVALANYLVSEDTEGRLAMGPSGQFPVRPGHPQLSRAQGPDTVRWMDADFSAAAGRWPSLSDELRQLFQAD